MKTLWYVARADLSRTGNAEAIHSREDARGLSAYGFDVSLVSSSSSPVVSPPDLREIILTQRKFPGERLFFELKFVWFYLWAGKRPDFIFFRGPTNLLLIGLFLWFVGVPFGMELNGVMGYRYGEGGISSLLGRLADRFFMRRCKAIVSVTKELNQLAAREACPGTVLAISANGVNTAQVRPCAVAAKDGRFALKLGYLGKCYQRRGHELAIGALAAMRRRGVEVGFKVVGGGPMVESLRERARQAGVVDNVEFVDEVPPEKMSEVVADCDVMWAYFEEWTRFALTGMSPMKVWTYMAIGKPFILHDPVGVLEQFRNVGGVLWTEASTVEGVADFMASVVAMGAAALVVEGAKGREYVDQNGTWTIHARRIGEAIDQFFLRRG